MEIKIGMDVEFMPFDGKRMVYARGPKSPRYLRSTSCDEFGHCVEIRPRESTDEFELIGNIMRAMSDLPKEFSYRAMNAVEVPEADFIELLRLQRRKDVPDCRNVYGKDILNSSDFEKAAIQRGNKVLYCGMHLHVSTSLTKNYEGKNGHASMVVDVPIPYILLTQLFDMYMFTNLMKDLNFSCGRYRSPGFFETKTMSHFEYRSLGSSAFTPERVAIIFRMANLIVTNMDALSVCLNPELMSKGLRANAGGYIRELDGLTRSLAATKPYDGDLLKIWSL